MSTDTLLPAQLWDVRAQLESQLRRVQQAQHLWEQSTQGGELSQMTALVHVLDTVISVNTILGQCYRDARSEAPRILPDGTG
jgi:hypothetical protein